MALEKSSKLLKVFLSKKGAELRQSIFVKQGFPENALNQLWAILALCLDEEGDIPPNFENGVVYMLSLAKNLGKTSIKLFSEHDVLNCYLNLKMA